MSRTLQWQRTRIPPPSYDPSLQHVARDLDKLHWMPYKPSRQYGGSSRPAKRRRVAYTKPQKRLAIETKNYDTFQDGSISGPSQFSNGDLLNSVPRGDTDTNRIGRQYCMKKLHVRANIRMKGTKVVRLLVYLDNQPTYDAATGAIAVPTWQSILQSSSYTPVVQNQPTGTSSTNPAVPSNPVYAFKNLDQTERFRILKDKIFPISQLAEDSAGNEAFHTVMKSLYIDMNETVKMLDHPIGGSTFPQPIQKALRYMILIDSQVVNNEAFNYSVQTRLVYTDK